MKISYTDQSYESLGEIEQYLLIELEWANEKVLELRSKLLDKADSLVTTFNHFQEEEYLEHLEKGYRRAIEGFYKIIYLVEGEEIIITDFFDTRQDPLKMKG